MNTEVGEKYTAELIKLFDQQHDALYNGRHSLCLTIPCLQYIQRRFSNLQETGASVPTHLVSYQKLQDHFCHIRSLKLIIDRRTPPLTRSSILVLNLEPFRALQSLILKKVPLNLITGLQRLRGQLRVFVVQRCDVKDLDDVIVRCGGDNSTSLAWSSLKELDISYNLIMELGDSLQYLHSLEKVNFSNNNIGKRPHVCRNRSGVEEESGSAAIVTPDQHGDDTPVFYTEGVQSIDNVHFLHLGFNKLRQVPKFGSRAKYNLRVLILRNNELVLIDGLEELDNLVDLDLTDNLLSKHNSLQPFHNLHHLSMLLLQGNPLAFHTKHRMRTAENLSNLIDKNMFKLDGKKLTSTEKKLVPHSMTHHFSNSSSNSGKRTIPTDSITSTTLLDVPMAQSVPNGCNNFTDSMIGLYSDPDLQDHGLHFASVPNSLQNKKKHREKDWHIAEIIDSDNEKSSSNTIQRHDQNHIRGWHTAEIVDSEEEMKTSGSTSDACVQHGRRKAGKGSKRKKKKEKIDDPGSLPLKNQKKMKKDEEMRKQMDEKWLEGSADKSFSITDRSSSTSQAETSGAANRNSPRKESTLSTKRKGSGQRKPLKNDVKREVLVDVVLSDCEGEFGPRTSSPDRESPVDINGDYYIMDRYESEVEEERVSSLGKEESRDQVFVRLSDDFLEEINVNGKMLDRWDLHCLTAASVESKMSKSTAQSIEVLLLQFNLERKDRCTRAYVLTDEGDRESIMEILEPIVEQNESTLSMGNKLECLHCQHVFDRAQAIEPPSDSPEPLRYSTNYRQTSISKLMCPFCHSQILQQSMPRPSFKPGSRTNQQGPPNGAAAVADPYPLYPIISNKVHQGFNIPEDRSSPPKFEVEVEVTGRDDNLDQFVVAAPSVPKRVGNDVSRSHQTSNTGENNAMDDGRDGDSSSTSKDSSRNSEREGVGKQISSGYDEQASCMENSYLNVLMEGETRLDSSKKKDESSKREKQEYASELLTKNDPKQTVSLEDTFDPWISEKKALDLKINAEKKGLDLKINAETPQLSEKKGLDLKINAETPRLSEKKGLDLKINTELPPKEGDREGSGFRGYAEYSDEIEGGFGGGRGEETGRWKEEDVWDQSSENAWKIPSPYELDYDDVPEPIMRNNISIPPRSKDTTSRYNLPSTSNLSTSVPSQKTTHQHFSHHRPEEGDGGDRKVKIIDETESSCGCNKSDYHPRKWLASTPPKKSYVDPYLQDTDRSLSGKGGAVRRNSSGRCTADSDSSGRGGGGGGHRRDFDSSGVCRHRKSQSLSARGFSSGESHRQSPRVYTSGEKSREGTSIVSQVKSGITGFIGLSTTTTTSPRLSDKDARSSSREGNPNSSRNPSSGRPSSGSGDGPQHNLSHSFHSSSDGTGRKKASSPLIIYRDDDPKYVHYSFDYYLNTEIFDSAKKETFRIVFRSQVITYGEPGELPVLVVISNIRFYIFQIIAPESCSPEKWLVLVCKHSLCKLVYIDHGVAYQFLRVEFKSNGCYTFLMRDANKCKLCSTQLSLCVADAPESSLRNVGVCPFNIDALTDPESMLESVIKLCYGSASGKKSPTGSLGRYSSLPSGADDLVLYRLAHRYNDDTGGRRTPVTIVATNDTIFLSKENFAHWPLPRIQPLPDREALLPPFLDVEQRGITDVESIILDRDQLTYVVVQFFRENSGHGASRQWKLNMHSTECVSKLVAAIKTTWEKAFQTSFLVVYK